MTLLALLSVLHNIVLQEPQVVLIQKQKPIAVYKDRRGNEELTTIFNDTLTENYFVANIYMVSKKYAFIRGSYAFDDKMISGWVDKKEIGIYLIMRDSIPLFKSPDKNSKISLIRNPQWYPLQVLGVDDDWLYVKYQDSTQKVKGWLPIEYQCANPYTTCN